MKRKRYVLGAAVVAVCAAGAAPAATVTFSGRLLQVAVNDGGVFSAAAAGSRFNARFVYPNSAGPSTIDEPDEADYPLTGTAELEQGGRTVSGQTVSVNIQNDQPLDADGIDFLNGLLTPDPPVAAGARVDSFTLVGLQQGAFERDPDPNDGDDEERLFNGVGFEFVQTTTAAALYDSLDYRPFPPSFAQTELRVFVVREADADGRLIFEAFGVIEQTKVIELFGGDFEETTN